MQSKPVFQLMRQGGFISSEKSLLLADSCRDEKISVFQDPNSKLIYLDPHYQGKAEDYYSKKVVPSSAIPRNDMDVIDTERRSALLKPFIAGKRWLDFGCGPGYQLREDSRLSAGHLGVELNSSNCEALSNDGYNVSSSLADVSAFRPQVVSMFHVMEHLADPANILQQLSSFATENATLLVEVPHAGDWLLQHGPAAFKSFTFWSEHLILHTRASLQYVLEQSGWHLQHIIAVQRYPVWNHLQWCLQQKPTGFTATPFDSAASALQLAYEQFLASRDQTDTLIAVATRRLAD
ncbi:class I SAM-dependent methyltransferase [Arsukibacterium indicum]|uniref:Class I SAM-dependent methyltransferase n=1 Tax=Arsukibacterium indicum TaxID=2848612 RepID=A0ABS6MGV4_9GAMM|nr:class I SAM-dependent methyltransferase [Arsukibacterium indicum]MBV2127875.1 class I SAM-dependent methyltransferase [Arsukibacterium indicum]